MIAETGHYALILGLAVAIVQTVLPLWGTRTRDQQLMAVAVPAAQTQFLLITDLLLGADDGLRHVRLLVCRMSGPTRTRRSR